MFVVLLSWIAAGLVIGFIASKVVSLRGDDPKFGIGAAVVGGFVAGLIYAFSSGVGVSVWTVWGVVWAAVGALIAVVAWHAVRSRSISTEKYVPRSSY
jgi:uncharacterized membrane protein YeaQ/YmgE (transglycosylase-associated protein family)